MKNHVLADHVLGNKEICLPQGVLYHTFLLVIHGNVIEDNTLNRMRESIPCSTNNFRRFFSNIIGLPERRNKSKSVLEITKIYYF